MTKCTKIQEVGIPLPESKDVSRHKNEDMSQEHFLLDRFLFPFIWPLNGMSDAVISLTAQAAVQVAGARPRSAYFHQYLHLAG